MQDYSAAFISASEGLYRREIKTLLSLRRRGLSKNEMRDYVVEENPFQLKNHQTNIKVFNKVYKRIHHIDQQLETFIFEGSRQDINAILLYCYLKTYRLLLEFAYEVIHFNYHRHRMVVTKGDIVEFFERKEEQSTKLKSLSPSSKSKMQQVMIRAFVDAELLFPHQDHWEIQPIAISDQLISYIQNHDDYHMIMDITLNQ